MRIISRFIILILIMLTCSASNADTLDNLRCVDSIGNLIIMQQRSTLNCSMINCAGDTIIPFGIYDLSLHSISENLFCVEKVDGNVRYALCNDHGMITDFDYLYIEASDETNMPLLAVNLDGQCGFIDEIGTWIITPQWYYAEPFSEGLAYVMEQNRHGYIKRDGKYSIVLDNKQFFSAKSFSQDRAYVQSIDKHFGYIDHAGSFVIPCVYLDAYTFSNGWARVADEKGYFYIDVNGKPSNQKRWKAACDYLYGYGIVCNSENQYGIMDQDGNLTYPPIACNILSLSSPNTVWIAPDKKSNYGLFDLKKRHFVTSAEWEIPDSEGFPYYEGYYIVQKDGHQGVIDENGEVFLPSIYEQVFFQRPGKITVQINGEEKFIVLP